MARQIILYVLTATFGIGGVALVTDLLVETDEEQLEVLAHDLTERDADARVDAVLQWMDTSRAAVEVQAEGGVARFLEGEDEALSEEVHTALGPFARADLEVVQRSVHADGDRATVAVRARAGAEVHDARFALARSGQGWVVDRVQVP